MITVKITFCFVTFSVAIKLITSTVASEAYRVFDSLSQKPGLLLTGLISSVTMLFISLILKAPIATKVVCFLVC